ncbi:hypothetical protein LCGC14_1471790 [marine sediment metagenome]|uniref:Uncharacterized protein n=1 Tax=marine sediment metagenome TaxID=412755 RepID=A0A0F9JCU6_9ZZZZ
MDKFPDAETGRQFEYRLIIGQYDTRTKIATLNRLQDERDSLRSQVTTLGEERKLLREALELIKIKIHFLGMPGEKQGWGKQINTLEKALSFSSSPGLYDKLMEVVEDAEDLVGCERVIRHEKTGCKPLDKLKKSLSRLGAQTKEG